MTPAAKIDLTRPLEGVVYERRDGIAFIRSDRPGRGNSLAPAMPAIFRASLAELPARLRSSSYVPIKPAISVGTTRAPPDCRLTRRPAFLVRDGLRTQRQDLI